jgi:hypothetical protein
MKSFALPLLLSLGTLALASPCSPHGVTITPQQILHVAPNTTTCADAPANAVGECATAIQAAPALSTAFTKYALTSKAEQAAVLGLIAFESGEFMYNRNHYPGVPGQGSTFHPFFPFFHSLLPVGILQRVHMLI